MSQEPNGNRLQMAIRMKRESLLQRQNYNDRLTWAIRKSLKVDTQFFFMVSLLVDNGEKYNWTKGIAQLEEHTLFFSKETDSSRASISRVKVTNLDRVSCMNSDKSSHWGDTTGNYMKMVAQSCTEKEDESIKTIYIKFNSKQELIDFLKILL